MSSSSSSSAAIPVATKRPKYPKPLTAAQVAERLAARLAAVSLDEPSNPKDEAPDDAVQPVAPKQKVSEELEPINEFGVQFHTITVCDSKCLTEEDKAKGRDAKCVCATTKGRGVKIHPALKPHQVKAIAWTIEREASPVSGIYGGINSSDMGLGKTVETLTLIMHDYVSDSPPQFPTLIVCPLISILSVWVDEIQKFLGKSCPYLVLRRDQMSKEDYDTLSLEEICKYRVVITNYETVRTVAKKHDLYADLFETDNFGRKSYINAVSAPSKKMMGKKGDIMLFNTPWRRLVFDEGHEFANPKSALFYSVMCLYSTRKLILSGTPLRNHSRDLYSLFRVLGFNGVTVPKQFTLKLYNQEGLDQCIWRETKESAKIEIPPINHKNVIIRLEGKEREIYEYYIRATKEAFDGFMLGCVAFANVLTLFLRLRQCCLGAYTILAEAGRDYKGTKAQKAAFVSSQKALDGMTAGLATWIADVHGTAGIQSAKCLRTMQIIGDRSRRGEKGIVFTTFTKYIDILEKAIKQTYPGMLYEIVDGGVTGDDRIMALNRFKRGKAMVLFISYKVGCQSLNLTEASYSILEETVWTPATELQAQARSHRVGQEKIVTVYKLVAEDTIEQKMQDICAKKTELFDQFIGGRQPKNKKDTGKLDAAMLHSLIAH